MGMAEIKSTLDLIMERTKNLTMTDEEKQNLHLKTLQGKAKGWIQRYLDGISEIRDLRRDLDANRDDRKLLTEMLRTEALNHIQPDGNNDRILQFLQNVLGEDTKPFSQLIEAFMQTMRRQMAGHITGALQTLEAKGVRGSAVIPNLDKDPAWQSWLSSSNAAFKRSLGA